MHRLSRKVVVSSPANVRITGKDVFPDFYKNASIFHQSVQNLGLAQQN